MMYVEEGVNQGSGVVGGRVLDMLLFTCVLYKGTPKVMFLS